MQLKDYDIICGNEIDIKMVSKSVGNLVKKRSPEYKFHVLLHGSDKSIGHINLRFGNNEKIINYIGHIGYGIDENYRGNKYSVKACELLKVVLLDYKIEKVIITCNPDNYPSRNTCELIGANLLEIIEIPKNSDAYSETETKKCRYEWLL
ncbi:GNAT family N-acetyltransferase [Helicovermis profundi]|uniref:N-acetyltransferase domain-containing protein n=1 Tax=Helicovermis profundi TaxID=3065157 RepID=A0AAU9EM75_9FIRM|nr:hypothetical protein HLPR_15200 [Clostridia bacterium S502]